MTYLLLTNQNAYEKLRTEVRTAFQHPEEINLISVAQLPYLQACLEEGLRMYPPIANGLPRVCPPGGATIIGNMIPENVSFYTFVHLRRGLLIVKTRPTFPFTNGRSIDAKSTSKKQIHITPNDSWGTQISRMTGVKCCSPSMLGHGIA